MRSTLASLIVALCVALVAYPAAADEEEEDKDPPCVRATWQAVVADCSWSHSDFVDVAGSDKEHTWVVAIQCGNGGICAEHVECSENGASGFMHDVYRDGVDVGDVCVPDEAVKEVDIVKLVIREFKRMEWPASDLVVQPPGGKTLVNFETNFYTLNNQPILKSVTVAGQRVEIRAIPTSYTFHFGDDTRTTTASPGRPHPNLDVTHVYEQAGAVGVRLDTTYGGEYRIGNSDWAPIAETLTVTGATQDLEVVEAVPQLVLE